MMHPPPTETAVPSVGEQLPAHHLNLQGDEPAAFAHPDSDRRLVVRKHGDLDSPRHKLEGISQFVAIPLPHQTFGDREAPAGDDAKPRLAALMRGCRDAGGYAQAVWCREQGDVAFSIEDGLGVPDGTWRPGIPIGVMLIDAEHRVALDQAGIEPKRQLQGELRDYREWINGHTCMADPECPAAASGTAGAAWEVRERLGFHGLDALAEVAAPPAPDLDVDRPSEQGRQRIDPDAAPA